MGIKFSDAEWQVFGNIISGVETGGQRYSQGKWDMFLEAYANTAKETSITLGALSAFATNAHALMELIQKKYPTIFKKYDTAGLIAADLKASNWQYYDIPATSVKAQIIKSIIGTPEGIECQKELFGKNSQGYLEYCYNTLGISDHKALAMAINLCLLGGKGACKRVIEKTPKPYTLDNIYNALLTDTGRTQVGGSMYRKRQKCVYDWINQYWPAGEVEILPKNEEKDILADKSNNNKGGNTMSKVTYPAGWISNSGSDENGKYHGGKAGDQTGKEWRIIDWYNRPWTHVLRFNDANVRKTIAQLAIEAALNDHIGYDQYQRTTFWYQLAKVGYKPANITVDCEADCSAGVTAVCKATGYLLGISGLKNLSPDIYTGNLRKSFKAAGFEVLTGSKYLKSSEYLLAGDILLNEGHHAATCISSGSKSGEGPTEYDGISVSIGGTITNITPTTTSGGLSTTVKSDVYVKANNTPLRTWAGKENSQLSSYPTVNKNQRLGKCDELKASDGSLWYFVKIGTKFGFVEASAVSNSKIEDDILLDTPAVNNSIDKKNKKVVVNGVEMDLNTGRTLNNRKIKWIGQVDVGAGTRLNYRVWPGEKSNMLTSMPYINDGAAVFVYDVMLDSNDNIWLYINTENPTTGKKPFGFVRAEYIKKI